MSNKNPQALISLFVEVFHQEFPLGVWTSDNHDTPFDETWRFEVQPNGEAILRVVLDDGTNHEEFEWVLNLRS